MSSGGGAPAVKTAFTVNNESRIRGRNQASDGSLSDKTAFLMDFRARVRIKTAHLFVSPGQHVTGTATPLAASERIS